ncbi:MAG TPA: hypothetical protein VF290_02165 [Pyrinomonadaceae bacterium]
MKKLITFLGICTTVAILALPAAAHTTIAQPDTAVQDPCTDEGKTALYQAIRKNLKDDQAKAYEDSKKYLACPPPAAGADDSQQKIIDYLKNFVAKYEEADKKNRFRKLLYVDKKYPEAYALGKEILAAEPENVRVMVDLGANGYLVAKDPALAAESVEYAKRAMQMLDSGKTIDDWQPLTSKEVAVAYMNYTIGSLSLEKDPATALKHLLKAAQFETPLKKSPYTYAYIAGAYETGPYAKLSDEYKIKFQGKDETPESKLALANIHQIVDRMIDAYARAVAMAGSDPNFSAAKTGWNESLTQWYKFRNNDKTDGMNELVAGILSKPLPPEPTPITVLPAGPASTPAGNTGAPQSGNGAGNGAAGTTAPASTTKPAATTPTTGSTAKPGTKPDRPRNRR